MSEQETIRQLKEQVKTLRKERDRFERDLHDERRYIQGIPGERPYQVRQRTIIRSCTEHTDEQVRQLRARLPSPSDIGCLWDTDWDRLHNLLTQLRLLAKEIADLEHLRDETIDSTVAETVVSALPIARYAHD